MDSSHFMTSPFCKSRDYKQLEQFTEMFKMILNNMQEKDYNFLLKLNKIPLYSYNSSATCTDVKPFVLFTCFMFNTCGKKSDQISVRILYLQKMLKFFSVFLIFIFVFCGLISCFTCDDDLYRDCKNRVANGGCEVRGGGG